MNKVLIFIRLVFRNIKEIGKFSFKTAWWESELFKKHIKSEAEKATECLFMNIKKGKTSFKELSNIINAYNERNNE